MKKLREDLMVVAICALTMFNIFTNAAIQAKDRSPEYSVFLSQTAILLCLYPWAVVSSICVLKFYAERYWPKYLKFLPLIGLLVSIPLGIKFYVSYSMAISKI